ncbi:uncharacterized protein LOC121728554 [Aricia agestis]|uniref:uncharacterized protein LOC121728554 n=1 Tax=Aricia agestis TaxID=91739 RepID=UPI001C20738F|nr:uncharacterized protein LOC121728554 [Aricia agestis]
MKFVSKIFTFHALVSSLASATYCVPNGSCLAASDAVAANTAGATTAGVAGAWATGARGAATYGAVGASNAIGTALKSIAAWSTATDLALKAGAQWGATAFGAGAYGAGLAAQRSASLFAPPVEPAVRLVPSFQPAATGAAAAASAYGK